MLSKHFQVLDRELIEMYYKQELVGAIRKIPFSPELIPTYNTCRIGVVCLSVTTNTVATYISKYVEEEDHE